MNIKEYLENNTIYIIPNNFKDTMLKVVNNFDLLNIKIITLSKLKKKILFDYDEKTINYLIKNKGMSYKNAVQYLESLYYLTDNLPNKKLQELKYLKDTLDNKNLLIYDNYFLNSLANKKIYILGFDYLYKFDLFIIKRIENIAEVKYIGTPKLEYTHSIFKFKNINEEVEYIANEILQKLNNEIDINDIYIANYNSEYELTIKRIFNFYKIPINLNSDTSLYDTKIGTDFLNNLDNYKNILNNINDDSIHNTIIDILNKYYWADNFISVKELLIEDFKAKKIKNSKFKNAINLVELKDNQIDEQNHIFLLGFIDKLIPRIYKDDNLINDFEKNEILESTEELNQIEKDTWMKIIKKIKNLTITFSEQGLKGILYPSSLIDNFQINNMNYQVSSFSHTSNKFNLALILDEQVKYGTNSPNLNLLAANYDNFGYLTYSNKYNKINPDLIKNFYQNGLNLSYTKVNTYYECAFKYYLDYILKLNTYEETFEAYLGSLSHHILSKIYNFDFDFEYEKEFFLKNSSFDLTPENYIFIDKMCDELKFAINILKEHLDNTLFKEIECEKNIKIEKINDVNVIFTGIIDKVMRYEEKIAIIDYKTYTPNIDLSLVNYGLRMQLPMYVYLIKNLYPDSKIMGIYLQYITRNIIAYNQKKTIEEIKRDNLKLVGYTAYNEQVIEEFDSTYKNSKFIKGMSLTAKGFSRFAKLLKENDFNILSDLAEKIIDSAIENILKANFEINPKILEKNNLSCTYCKYKSLCFVKYDDCNHISADKDLTFLGGDNNENMD